MAAGNPVPEPTEYGEYLDERATFMGSTDAIVVHRRQARYFSV